MAFSGWMMGFDSGYSGTVLQMQPFNKAFGHCVKGPAGEICRLGATAQSISSISTLFSAIGSGLSGITTHYIGRRATLQVGCLLVAIGAAGQLGTSTSYAAYLACKCIAGVGVGYFQVVGIAYGVECISPQKRGLLLAFFGVGLLCGTLVISAVCLGSSTISNDWAWKTPIACAIPVSLVYITILMFFPESPRWLMLKSQESKARLSFAKFYGETPQSDTVSRQIQATRDAIEFERAVSSSTSWRELFHRNYIRRTLISGSILVGASFCGTYFVIPYSAIFLGGIGIKNPFLINVIMGSCGVGGTLFGPLAVEYLGRRRTILLGFGIMGSCMLIFAAVSSALGSSSTTAKNVLIAFICIWYFSYGSCIVSAGWLSSSEVHSLRLRAPGQAIIGAIAQVTSFAASFWTPYMLNANYGNMGTNVGYFYFGLTVIIWIIMYFFVPETARLSLEQIDQLFEDGTPAWKTSLKHNKAIASCGIEGIISSGKF